MPRFKSLPLSLRVLILTIAVGALLVLVAINIPAILATTFERFSGFLGGVEPQQVSTPEYTSTPENDYVSAVKDLQTKSEESSNDSDDRFSRFDSLTSNDLKKMKTDSDNLKDYLNQVDNLDPPEKYKSHYDLFRSAIDDLYQATELAYSLASDPGSVTKSRLDEYRSYVNRANSNLEQADEILERESNFTGSSTTTIEGVTVAQLFDGSKKRYINVHAKAKEGEAHPPGISCADLTPASGSATRETSREVDLTPSRDSGVSGTATFQDTDDGVEVKLDIQGAPEGGVEHLVHIHEGATCQDDRNDQGGAIEFPLNSVKVEG